jgi:competence protein ComEC
MTRSPFSFALAPVTLAAVLAMQRSPELPSAAALTTGAACVLVLAALCGRAGPRWPRLSAWFAMVAVALGVACWAAHAGVQRLGERLQPQWEGPVITVYGVVDALPVPIQGGVRFTLRTRGCTATAAGDPSPPCRVPPRIQLSWQRGLRDALATEPLPTLRPGQAWTLSVRLRRPHAAVNPGAFDRELRWLQEGIGAVGSVRSGQLQATHSGGLRDGFERARAAVRDAIYEAAGRGRAEQAGVLAALAIGDQSAIAPPWWTLFNRTGVSHLMSISGLHVTMLAGLGGTAFALLWRTRFAARRGWGLRLPAPTARLWAAVGIGIAYALLAGWGIPARRTCFMLAAAVALLASGRTGSVIASVGAAAMGLVVLDPWAPLAPGFWLSFGGVLALVWAGSGVRFEPRRRSDAVREAVRAQWAATVALLPLGLWFFGSASLVGPLANAVAIPLVSAVITPLALAGGALATVSPAWGSVLIVPAATAVGALITALQWLAAVPHAALALPSPGIVALGLALAGAAVLLLPADLAGRRLGALGLLPLVAAPLARPVAGEIRITALDVGQGSAVVVQVGARSLVYDTGPGGGGGLDAGARVVAPWLRSQGITRPDLLVVSHPDGDHAGGALSLLQALPPVRFVSSLPAEHPIVAAAPDPQRCIRGGHWRWDEVSFEWLHPGPDPEPQRGSATNALSCVLRIRGAAGSVLLAGDIEAGTERALLQRLGPAGLAADVLLVPHHGSRTSSTAAFVDAVSPRWAIVQAAYRSRFGHPHPTVVARYRERGIAVLRTDADGAVQIRLVPDAPAVVRRSRVEPARYWRVSVGR